ncbi:MAG: hypothetical protein HY801_11580, partial [Candidatus Lindowbacteria bacterium]|nr:hypothetical protein [Candidatus Lindowbacteria bacterium]
MSWPATHDRFLYWARTLRDVVQEEMDGFFPDKAGHGKPFAYFWARQIRCEGPNCGRILPLIGNPALSKRGTHPVAVGFEYSHSSDRPTFGLLKPNDPRVRKTIKDGSATCICNYTTPVKSVRSQLREQEGGSHSSLLLAIGVLNKQNRKEYILPDKRDKAAIDRAQEYYDTLANRLIPNTDVSIFPREKIWGKAKMNVALYGIDEWSKAFTPRQKLQVYHFQKALSGLAPHIRREAGLTVLKLLVLTVNKVIDYCTSLCRWVPGGEFVAATNGGEKKIPMMWDYVEVVQHNDGPGSFMNMADWVARVIEHCAESRLAPGVSIRASATRRTYPDDSVDVLFTDPPYYDA